MKPFAHGIDLVEVGRIAAMLASHGERFLARVYTPDERAHGAGTPRHADHLAARFAAKEAALKALGTGWSGGIAWTDVEVFRAADGRPHLRLHGRAAELAAEQGLEHWSVSITHTGGMAAASVIGWGA